MNLIDMEVLQDKGTTKEILKFSTYKLPLVGITKVYSEDINNEEMPGIVLSVEIDKNEYIVEVSKRMFPENNKRDWKSVNHGDIIKVDKVFYL